MGVNWYSAWSFSVTHVEKAFCAFGFAPLLIIACDQIRCCLSPNPVLVMCLGLHYYGIWQMMTLTVSILSSQYLVRVLCLSFAIRRSWRNDRLGRSFWEACRSMWKTLLVQDSQLMGEWHLFRFNFVLLSERLRIISIVSKKLHS